VWNGQPFSGTKIALLCSRAVVAYLRDDKVGIPFPGQWDLPGGGREGDESPVQCAIREVEEEFGIRIAEDSVTSLRRFDGASGEASATYFCVAHLSPDQIAQIAFGDEGQRWALMDCRDFIARDDAVPDLRRRLEQHLADGG
jgi:8-oxo-dGTP diphosphatase